MVRRTWQGMECRFRASTFFSSQTDTHRQQKSYQEGSKHGDRGEEVPDVMVVEEQQQDAVPVVLTRLGRSFLCWQREAHKRNLTEAAETGIQCYFLTYKL